MPETRHISRRHLLAGSASLLALAGCKTDGLDAASLAQTGLNIANQVAWAPKVTKQDEVNIGRRLYGKLVDAYGGPYRNRAIQTAMEQFAEPLIKSGSRRSLPWEITVLDDDTVNAWALPGGKMAINKGLLRYVASDAELAAVIAHEIGHVELRHAAREMESERFSDMVTGAGRDLIMGQIYDSNVRTLSDLAIDEMEGAMRNIVTAGYSQGAEYEADKHILDVFELAGYDARQAPGFFRTLLQLYPADTEGTTSLFSTHPGTISRLEALETAAASRPPVQLPAASRGYAEIKAVFPTRRYFRRHGASST
ncbi:MAG: M48 family metallopeptidase [Alphaproteobacteria bacterium]|jgi:predicted Zn-dependent protease|nr:M48 family metallopeptidase [Alphaproteobacteria bacterium]